MTGRIVTADSMLQLYERLEKSGVKPVKLEDQNHMKFNNTKNEMIVSTRRRRHDLKRMITDVRITLRGHTMSFNTEVTR